MVLWSKSKLKLQTQFRFLSIELIKFSNYWSSRMMNFGQNGSKKTEDLKKKLQDTFVLRFEFEEEEGDLEELLVYVYVIIMIHLYIF